MTKEQKKKIAELCSAGFGYGQILPVNIHHTFSFKISVYARQKQCTAAQIALAWILKGNDFIVPIPGMRKQERVVKNISAAEVTLSDEEYDNLNRELNKLKIYGDRNGKDIARLASVPDNV